MPIPNLDELKDAVKKAREESKQRKFKQSFELIIKLPHFDSRKQEYKQNKSVILPHPLKSTTISVFAVGEKRAMAEKAGAAFTMSRDELNALAQDKKTARKVAKSYDYYLAEPELMPTVGRVLGPFLGPRGKMPDPIPPNADVQSLLERGKRTAKVRMKDQPYLSVKIGEEDMSDQEIAENALAILNEIARDFKNPSVEIGSIILKLTMGKPISLGG
ncbi:MAG: 50S ribosomal protein L1 [Thermoprotei archaeon]